MLKKTSTSNIFEIVNHAYVHINELLNRKQLIELFNNDGLTNVEFSITKDDKPFNFTIREITGSDFIEVEFTYEFADDVIIFNDIGDVNSKLLFNEKHLRMKIAEHYNEAKTLSQ